ncbi:MAG TPA: AraC family transcriptional regulator [Longimicrobiaceae bacterium]|nr:AraC family transcriptional regulator [Longimicrobiaceae bacterium]
MPFSLARRGPARHRRWCASRWSPAVFVADAADRTRTRAERKTRAVDAAKRYVERHLHEPLEVGRLSREAKLAKHHFSRVFREVEGVSPWKYVRGRRVELARTLLDRGLPLSEVAYRAGFADQSHLTRAFKEATGRTPGEYRRERTNLQDGPG